MAYKIRFFALDHDYTELVFIGKIKATKEEPYSDLRPRLGKTYVVEWPFDFWDVEDGLRIRKQLEPLYEIGDIVHVIRVAPNAVDMSKRRRMGDDDYTIHDFADVDVVRRKSPRVGRRSFY